MKKALKQAPGQNVNLEEYLHQQSEIVNQYLDRFLPASDAYPEVIHQAIRYAVFAGGKRVRPVLALATTEALEGDFERAIYLAGALEMIHTYSLIHDDLPAMDDDDYRRGQPSAHKKFGEGIAILAGDALLTRAFQILAEMPDTSGSAERKIGVIHRICRAIGTERGMISGQVLDLTIQGKPFSQEQLEYIHSSKTGALIETSVYCAALLSEASEETCQRLGSFGSSIGLAFQIVDDILDVEGSPEELGKNSGKDHSRRKATYPVLYGVERSRTMVTRLIDNAREEIGFLGARGVILVELARFISTRSF